VIVFYVLSFFFTFLIGGIQQATGFAVETVSLPQWGPGLAALVMLLIFRRDGHRLSVIDGRVPASRYVLAALIPVGGALIVTLINSARLGGVDMGALPTPTWLLLAWMPLGALGEELGWRGYLHKRLGLHLNGLTSSLIVGVLWALWHIGMYANGPVYMAFFVLLMISYSIVIYALVADIRFNVLVAAVFHLMINVTNLPSFGIINQVDFMAVNALVWVVIAAVVVLTRRKMFVGGSDVVATDM